ncbi:MAG: AAA family ATPase, partial [Deltaproteobacteria bacterium]|nr:AAA family ATPase [Deltaproteobacteria bacterium]
MAFWLTSSPCFNRGQFEEIYFHFSTGFKMSTKRIKLASGLSDFSEIRTKGILYIDKTKYIHDLISDIEYKYWFLARPRRFGKTMFVDTLEQLFLGNEELFRGLYIHSKGYDFKPCPVIRLNMARSASSTDELKSSIISHLEAIAEEKELALKSQTPGDALERLIIDFQKKTKQPIVVLIDEYDKPILDHINNTELALKIRGTLHDFYVSLKNVEDKLRFVFVTGISKFGKTAIHSALNNLSDITHDDNYAAICGYTEKELLDNFSPLFNGLINSLAPSGIFNGKDNNKNLVNSILDKYNGYSWDGNTRILNPYSINNCFSKQKLDNYWWATGPPLLLEHAISLNPTAYLPSNWSNLTAQDVDKTEIDDLRPVSVLFQTGYLTIDTATIK